MSGCSGNGDVHAWAEPSRRLHILGSEEEARARAAAGSGARSLGGRRRTRGSGGSSGGSSGGLGPGRQPSSLFPPAAALVPASRLPRPRSPGRELLSLLSSLQPQDPARGPQRSHHGEGGECRASPGRGRGPGRKQLGDRALGNGGAGEGRALSAGDGPGGKAPGAASLSRAPALPAPSGRPHRAPCASFLPPPSVPRGRSAPPLPPGELRQGPLAVAVLAAARRRRGQPPGRYSLLLEALGLGQLPAEATALPQRKKKNWLPLTVEPAQRSWCQGVTSQP